jgi:flagellar export protein FliJ
MAKFRLERVIEIKNRLRDDKKKDLEREMSALANANGAIESVGTEISTNYETMGAAPMGGSDFSVLRDFLLHLEIKRAGLLVERERIGERLTIIRAELLELAKEVNMLETLKAKAFEIERKLLNRKEQKNLDEMALRSNGRRS